MTTPEDRNNKIARRLTNDGINTADLALSVDSARILAERRFVEKVIIPGPREGTIRNDEGRAILFVLDSSASMARHRQAVIAGYNGIIDRIAASPAAPNTLIHTVDIYGRVISPLGLVSGAKKIDSDNYTTTGGDTPLRDALLGSSTQMAHEILRQSEDFVFINGIIVALTDGRDNKSEHTENQTKAAIEDMRKTRNVLYIGAGLGSRIEYVDSFGRIGIPEQFVISGSDVEGMFRLLGDVTTSTFDPTTFRNLALKGLPSGRDLNA